MEVYLDFNVYLSILKREINNEIHYEYILSKLRHLRRIRKEIKFPYSPAHMEEIAVNLKKDCDTNKLIVKRLAMIEYYSQSYEYLPGIPKKEKIIKDLKCMPLVPELLESRRKLEDLLKTYELGLIKEEPATRKVIEKPIVCFNRVVGDLDATDWAHENDVFHLGRRNQNSLNSNFEAIHRNPKNIQTFESYHREVKLGPKIVSQLQPFDVFSNEAVKVEFSKSLKENMIDKLLKGQELLSSHSDTEDIITVVLNFLEKIGYNQEENNKLVKLRSRMHDVSHAIYGAKADFFVTNDVRFRNKLKATYHFLDIPCKVLSPDEFVRTSFINESDKVIYISNNKTTTQQ
ncbi:hypothetical protein [Shewanella algae]|uniref:hypothetical protein n=1 Tax=Shewanella algae TaxID=38313 RepID=UPI0031F500A0